MVGISPSDVSASSGTSALLVIDPQKTYSNGPLKISEIETRQKVISGLVDKYREAKAPVIWAQVSFILRLLIKVGSKCTD
jgi:nicotinamidase-related amidase